MYRKILAAVNEHLSAEIAERYALGMARSCTAKLYLCFVAGKGIDPENFNRAEDAVKRLFSQAMEMGLAAESITETGDPVAEIERIVKHENIGLVFASTRREDIKRRLYAGTVSRRLSLKLPCSVALVHVAHMGKEHPGKILAPLKAKIDHQSERAYFTSRMAMAFGAKVLIFHAPRPITKFFHGEIHLKPYEWEEKLPDDISSFMEYLKKYGIEYESRLSPGTTGRSITIEAFAKRACSLSWARASEVSLPPS